jgi:hypothetical protein
MTGLHRQADQSPARVALESIRWSLLVGFVAASLAGLGVCIYLLATDSKYLPVMTMALQGLAAVFYARRLALRVMRNRKPSPVNLADWISDSAMLIMWAAVLFVSIAQLQGWMHGPVKYATLGVLGLFVVGMPLYWWRGQRSLALALTARAAAGRWPWSGGD